MPQHAQSRPAYAGPRRGGRPTSGGPRRGSGRPQRRPVADPATAALDAALNAAAEAPAGADYTFAELGLPDRLVDALAHAGIERPFAIQTRTLPDGVAGRDVLGRAQTGSGKTLGFGLPMLARLAGGRRTTKQPRGLVLVPTRELAQQVATALVPLGRSLSLKVTTVYGGAPIGRQIADLERGVDVVVATPGRLIDLMERRSVDLSRVSITVLDEADYMADLGFMPAVTTILDTTPEGSQRMLFSATLDRGVGQLVTRYLSDPAIHAVAAAASQVDTMDHVVFTVRAEHKLAVATEVAQRPGRTLFFVRTKHGADRLAEQMGREGVAASAIHGNLTPGRPSACARGVHRRPPAGARRHGRRGPRHPRGRRRPRRALRPAERPQGLPAPLRPHRSRGHVRHCGLTRPAGAAARGRPTAPGCPRQRAHRVRVARRRGGPPDGDLRDADRRPAAAGA